MQNKHKTQKNKSQL